MKTTPKVLSFSTSGLTVVWNTSSFVKMYSLAKALGLFNICSLNQHFKVTCFYHLGIKSWEIGHFKEDLFFIIWTLRESRRRQLTLLPVGSSEPELSVKTHCLHPHPPHFYVPFHSPPAPAAWFHIPSLWTKWFLRIVRYKGFESSCLKISSGDRNASLLALEVLTRPRTPNLRQK